ncbi:unnamed protein product [Wuchereria bancrofti]|uniref:Uncharacterized protein n=1 Tax=Wuchereria bancrofti TaxID=6293 RepID=A0A3P7EMG1_WUCBA|nr:unnamed protein product [Wuchereria bancrofti]
MEKTKDFESFESNKIGIGLNSSNSFDQFNFTSLPDASVQQSRIDAQFEYSATPAFIMMLSLSVATFIAAFFQLGKYLASDKFFRIDAQFEYSATPAFIMMLSLSVATFIAAFFQV